MGMGDRQKAARTMRGPMRSPGAPSIDRRENRVAFWKAVGHGRSTDDASQAAGVSAAVGARWFRNSGGMPPLPLSPISPRYLSFGEREAIAIMRAKGMGVRGIAGELKRSPSTISREVRRNASTRTYNLEYRASTAQWHAELRARRRKVSKLATNDRLRDYVQERLSGTVTDVDGNPVLGPRVRWQSRRHGPRQDRRWSRAWSPEQIARRLPVDFPHDETMRISHEAIYQSLYIQGRGALRRELTACLRTGRALRVPEKRTGRGKNFISSKVMITQRPAEANDRAIPGHWEGDLVRHEALFDRAVMKGHRRRDVAAARLKLRAA